jgi:hypothetical protein
MFGVKRLSRRPAAFHPELPDDQSVPHDDYRDPKLPTSPESIPSGMHYA